MIEPTIGRIVHYRLTRLDVKEVNRLRVETANHQNEHRAAADGRKVHVGNQHHVGDVVPLIVVRVWPNEFDPENPVCRDYIPGDDSADMHFEHPLSQYGVNGQAILDGNDSLWVTSAPQMDAPGGWDWPALI